MREEWCGNTLCERRASRLGYLWHQEEQTEPCLSALSGHKEATQDLKRRSPSPHAGAIYAAKRRFKAKALGRTVHLKTEQAVRKHLRTNPAPFYLVELEK